MADILKEIRCTNCGTLAAKADISEGTVHIKCRKCGTIIEMKVRSNNKPESRGFQNRLGLNTKRGSE